MTNCAFRSAAENCRHCRCRASGIDCGSGTLAALGNHSHRLRGRFASWRARQDRQLPGQSNGSRRPPLLLEVRLGHALVSKEILPVADGQLLSGAALSIHYQGQSCDLTPISIGSNSSDAVMLVRQRLSRILFRRRFFNYPLTLDASTLRNLSLAEARRDRVELRQSAA